MAKHSHTAAEVHGAELTVSFELFLQPADLARPGFLGDGLDLLGSGGEL